MLQQQFGDHGAWRGWGHMGCASVSSILWPNLVKQVHFYSFTCSFQICINFCCAAASSRNKQSCHPIVFTDNGKNTAREKVSITGELGTVRCNDSNAVNNI